MSSPELHPQLVWVTVSDGLIAHATTTRPYAGWKPVMALCGRYFVATMADPQKLRPCVRCGWALKKKEAKKT